MMKMPALWILALFLLLRSADAFGQLIDVTKAEDSLIADTRVDAILTQSNSSVQIEGGTGTCLLTLHRDNPMQVTSGNAINGPDDFNAVCSQPGYVHVVDQINWCGNTGANFIGCSPMPGHCVVVMRYQDNTEWMLWMHEYGHSKGLDHRNGARALMAPTADPSHDSVTGLECATVQNTASSGTQGPPIASGPGPKTGITEFVKQTYYEGTPYAQARTFKKHDVDKLISMMNDLAMKPYLANIVTTLGMVGGTRATRPLIDFISSPAEAGNIELNRARKSAVMALGYVVNQTNDPKALNFLIEGTSSDIWKKRSLSSALARHFSSASILGLALTGKSSAHDKLTSISGEPVTPETESRIRTARQALHEHERVVRLGIAKYSSQGKQ